MNLSDLKLITYGWQALNYLKNIFSSEGFWNALTSGCLAALFVFLLNHLKSQREAKYLQISEINYTLAALVTNIEILLILKVQFTNKIANQFNKLGINKGSNIDNDTATKVITGCFSTLRKHRRPAFLGLNLENNLAFISQHKPKYFYPLLHTESGINQIDNILGRINDLVEENKTKIHPVNQLTEKERINIVEVLLFSFNELDAMTNEVIIFAKISIENMIKYAQEKKLKIYSRNHHRFDIFEGFKESVVIKNNTKYLPQENESTKEYRKIYS